MRLSDVVAASSDAAATSSRNARIARLADLLRGAAPEDARIAVSWLIGALPQGRIGLGPAAVRAALADAPAHDGGELSVRDVDTAFTGIRDIAGSGAARARVEGLRRIMERAGIDERGFLARLLCGELRHGALEGLLADAVARATALPVEDVRRAAQLAGELPAVAEAALREGASGLNAFDVQLFRPLQPMLAQPATDITDAMTRLAGATESGEVALDWKLDGARVQVHRDGNEVRVYTRRLNEVTASLPELVEVVRTFPAQRLILDGEAIALGEDGSPLPFQVTMSRFGSRVDVETLRTQVPLTTLCFDLLYVDGQSLISTSTAERFRIMRDVVPAVHTVKRLTTADVQQAEAFMAASLDAGHEGVVAKSLAAGYDAGRRGGAWLKVKQADTLDLVVLAAEWGHGRRRGWLSNLHLGARDPETGGFVMLGKTFKGLTDAVLEWQTRELLARETGREGNVVKVRPELVVEIAYEGVQTSPRYPGGVALRFARVKRYRQDKTADQADTIDRVRHG